MSDFFKPVNTSFADMKRAAGAQDGVEQKIDKVLSDASASPDLKFLKLSNLALKLYPSSPDQLKVRAAIEKIRSETTYKS